MDAPRNVKIFEGKHSDVEKEVEAWLSSQENTNRSITCILQSGVDTPTGARLQISIFYS